MSNQSTIEDLIAWITENTEYDDGDLSFDPLEVRKMFRGASLTEARTRFGDELIVAARDAGRVRIQSNIIAERVYLPRRQPPWERLCVRGNGGAWVAKLDGVEYHLNDNQSYLLRQLIDAKGGIVPGPQLKRDPTRGRAAMKIIANLPTPIRVLIRSVSGWDGGYCLADPD